MERQHLLVVLAIAAVIVLAQSSAAPALSSEEGPRVRTIHAVSDAPPVDVMLDSTEVFTNVGFGDVTDYTEASTGTYTITLQAHSDGTPLISDSMVFTDTDYTLAAAGTSATLDILKLVDDNGAPTAEMVRARVVHLSPEAPPVDVAIKDGPVLFSDVGFKEASDYVEIAAGTYDVEIRLAGTDMVLDTATLTVERNRVYTVFAIGTPPQLVQTVDEAYDPACPEFRTGPWEGDADFTVSSDRSRVVDFQIEIECEDNNFKVVAEEKPIEDCGIQFAASVFNLYDISGSGTFVSENDMEGSYSVTGSSNCSGTWQSTAVSDEGTTVYLPLVIRRWPSIPDSPVLDPIDNPDGDGDYTVRWNAAYLAEEYILEEDDDGGFSSPTERYRGPDTSWDAIGKSPGTYYYRVKAGNAWGDSGWSTTRSVTVGSPGDHYEGDSPWVSFDVEGQQVCNFEMEVPFEDSTCYVDLPECMDIVDGEFSYTALDPWLNSYENSITGAFTHQDRVEGHYSIHFCGNTLSLEPYEGDWEATKQ